MIIRLRKVHAVILLFIMVIISFVFAVKSENAQLTSAMGESRQLPVVMYHHITTSEKRSGRYVIMKSELESDLDYIKKCGYTCVTVSDLVSFTEGKTNLPEKIIMITFDDGFDSVYDLAWGLLKEKGMKAVVAAVGSIAQTYQDNRDTNVKYAYMSWERLREINDSDQFEVQNHSYDMHKLGKRKGLSKMREESEENYSKALTSDVERMQSELMEKSGINALALVYPYGAYSKSTLSLAKKMGFKCTMTCEEKVNTVFSLNKDSLYNLGRYNRASGKNTQEFFEAMGVKP